MWKWDSFHFRIIDVKDTNRKIRETVLIYIYGKFDRFQAWFHQHKYRWKDMRDATKATVLTRLGFWNPNFTTVFYGKYCSYLSISIFNRCRSLIFYYLEWLSEGLSICWNLAKLTFCRPYSEMEKGVQLAIWLFSKAKTQSNGKRF